MKKRGFTLVELLVVIAIIATILAMMGFAYSKYIQHTKRKKHQEYAHQVATALAADSESWSKDLIDKQQNNMGRLDKQAGYYLASKLGLKTSGDNLSGHDRFGIVSPCAQDVIKKYGNSCNESTPVSGGGTVRDHIYYYALAVSDEEGYVTANVGGETIKIRATAAVWGCGPDGKLEPYSERSSSDDVYSWDEKQVIR